jgi:hypothetical protein
MKCTNKNIELIFNVLLSQMEDENGRGEFDGQSDLISAIERIIEWIEDDGQIEYDM